MNPIETTTETSKRKLEIRCVSSGASQICNSSVPLRDQIINSSVYGDSAMIKYVIGATNNNEQQSILKKSLTNHSSIASTQTSISNSIKTATPAVETQQSSKVLTQNEPKVNVAIASSTSAGQSLIKLPTIKNLPNLSEKQSSYKSVIKRSLPTQTKQQMSAKPLAVQTTGHGHIFYKGKNGHSSTNYPEMMSASLLARKSEHSARKLPTMKDMQKPLTKRLEMKPLNNYRRTYSVDTSTAEVTQISSTVTLTKAPILSSKQTKTLPSPLVTIEKKGATVSASLFNCSKQGKIHFPNSAESMDIVVNTIGESKMISLGNDKDESAVETGQKSLLLKQCSPTNREKTPPKLAQLKPKQQSLLKVNSLARLLHTSPRTKRSKSLTSIGTTVTKRRRMSLKKRRSSAVSDGNVSPPNTLKKPSADPLAIKVDDVVSPLKQKTKELLLCDEKIESIPSTSSNSSFESTHKKEPVAADINPFQLNTVLEMLSVFNMLTWKDRIGSSKDSSIQFHLNEFNLLQIAERCPPRDRIHTAYEKPIYERESSPNTSDYSDPLYLCRRCNCRGAAIDFLAPEFCSYECFRHESRKRPKLNEGNLEKLGRDRIKKPKKCLIGDGTSPFGSRSGIDSALDRLAPKRVFSWDSYLSLTHSEPAPIDLFLNPFPCGLNLFEVGMKLEAIDPDHNSLFCVCTIVEKKGYRLKLKFDGYSKIHNFWVNADSMDIFPPGWCAKTNRVLQPPKGMNLLTFNWPTYLNKTKSTPAPRGLFTHLNSSSSTNPFKVGMRLEADDLKNTGKVCVATIADVLDNRVLIHFDGWDESYDYWIDINSPYIHPIGWHRGHALELVPPPDWEKGFSWNEYLEFTRSQPVQSRMFSRRYPIEFTTGMKLEVVDIKNPCLIRPGTVFCRNEYKILVHLDGWSNEHTFWVNDDSPDIHPIGWSNETNHTLEPPPGYDRPPAEVSDKPDMPCPIKGCRGIGNAKRLDLNFHANEDTCPYAPKNWENEMEKPSRLDEIGRFVYTGDVPNNKRRSTSEKNVTETSSEDQKHQLQQDCKLQVPTTIESNQVLPTSAQVPNEEIKLAREFLRDYGPRLKQNYFIWRENGNFNPATIQKNPLEWTTKEAAEYITTKCHPIGHIFYREDIDGMALLSMQQSDLTDILKIKLGPAVKIYSHILHLRSQVVSRFSTSKP